MYDMTEKVHKRRQNMREVQFIRTHLTPQQRSIIEEWMNRGECHICGRTRPSETRSGRKYRLNLDHDHSTMMVRGALCMGCNVRLGKYEIALQKGENIPLPRDLEAYLNRMNRMDSPFLFSKAILSSFSDVAKVRKRSKRRA